MNERNLQVIAEMIYHIPVRHRLALGLFPAQPCKEIWTTGVFLGRLAIIIAHALFGKLIRRKNLPDNILCGDFTSTTVYSGSLSLMNG